MAKDIDQVKEELLTLYRSEQADARRNGLTEREAVLDEAMAMMPTLYTKSDLLFSLAEQADTLVLPISKRDRFVTWLRSNFSTADLENFGIFLNHIPTVGLEPGDPCLLINADTTRLYGSLDLPVVATIVGAWTVDVTQATVLATQEAHVHVKDDVAKVYDYSVPDADASIDDTGLIQTTAPAERCTLTDQECELRDALVERLRQSGIELIDNVEEGQHILDEASSRAKMQSMGQSFVSGDRSTFAETLEVTDTVRQQKVFHGSGADFDAFDFSHMGEGEGNQAFGCGGYVTDVEGIGITYAQKTKPDDSLTRSRLEFEINRLKEALPFRRGEVKREGGEELKRLEEELAQLNERLKSFLYVVEIPDDNGTNYLKWEKPLSKKALNRVNKYLEAKGMKTIGQIYPSRCDGKLVNKDLYEALSAYPNTDKIASEILSEIGFVGISYPSNFYGGGTKEDWRNYVLFKEEDMKITDKVRFFRTSSGESYGFTVNGKIYIDPRIATAETPIHEYAHLWASLMRTEDKLEWDHIVSLLKNTPVWQQVKMSYPDLKTDNEIADEVLAHYSGSRGAERLRKELSKSGYAAAAIQRVKEILARFWHGIANMFRIHFSTAEEVADRVLFDLLRGVNPYAQLAHIQPNKEKARTNGRIHYQPVGGRVATGADKAMGMGREQQRILEDGLGYGDSVMSRDESRNVSHRHRR
ncbi:MAG: hypothetical protein ACI3ZY_07735 [Parabacteroides sp.]